MQVTHKKDLVHDDEAQHVKIEEKFDENPEKFYTYFSIVGFLYPNLTK